MVQWRAGDGLEGGVCYGKESKNLCRKDVLGWVGTKGWRYIRNEEEWVQWREMARRGKRVKVFIERPLSFRIICLTYTVSIFIQERKKIVLAWF